MMMNLRKSAAKIVTFLLFAMLIMSFAVWGIGDIFRGGGPSTVVADVGHTEIDQYSFSRTLNQEMSRLRRQFGGEFDISQAQAIGVVDQVLQQMINQALFTEQAAKMGLEIGDEQLRAATFANTLFHNQQGEFDRDRYFGILQANGWNEARYRQIITQDLIRNQLGSALLESVVVPTAVADVLHAYDEELRVAETLFVPLAGLPETLAPSDEELEAVLAAYPARFRLPEYRALSLIQLKGADFSEEVQIAEEDLQAAFEDRRDQFDRPERRRFEQVLFSDQASAQAAIEMMKDGQAFASAAEATAGQAPISLGPFSLTDLAPQMPELAEVVFQLDERSFSEPVQSAFGWHLIHVLEVEPAYTAVFEDVRDQLAKELALEEATDVLVSTANRLDDELAAGFELEEASETLSLPMTKITAIDPQGRDPVGTSVEGLPPLSELLPVMLQTQEGQASLLTETASGDYFVLRVDSVTAAQPKPLADVRDEAAQVWREQKRGELSREQAEGLAERVRGGESLEDLAAAEDLIRSQTQPIARDSRGLSTGASPQLITSLFGLKEGEIAVAETTGGYLIARLIDVQTPAPLSNSEAIAALAEEIGQTLEGDLVSSFIASLRSDIGVEVNQRAVQDTLDVQ